MAKKKDFKNIVDESFEEGYQSEPVIKTTAQTNFEAEEKQEDIKETKVLSENELRLRRIRAEDPDTLNEIWNREDRSTYYLTDLHRACIDILAHEEGIKKQQVVGEALLAYFSDEVKEAARERVITMAVKNLEREIEKENKK